MKAFPPSLIAMIVIVAAGGWAAARGQSLSLSQPGGGGASTGVSVSTVNGQSVVTVNGEEVHRGPTQGMVSSRSSNINGVEYSAVFDGDTPIWENVPGAGEQLRSAGADAGNGEIDLAQFGEQQRQAFEQMTQAQRQFMQNQGNVSFGTNAGSGGGRSPGLSGSRSFRSSGSCGGGTLSSGGSHGGAPNLRFSGTKSLKSGGRGGKRGSGTLPLQKLKMPTDSDSIASPGDDAENGASESSIGTCSVNGRGEVVYKGRKVWSGRVKDSLRAYASNIDGVEYAAAWDGDRLVWESRSGAGEQLNGETDGSSEDK